MSKTEEITVVQHIADELEKMDEEILAVVSPSHSKITLTVVDNEAKYCFFIFDFQNNRYTANGVEHNWDVNDPDSLEAEYFRNKFYEHGIL